MSLPDGNPESPVERMLAKVRHRLAELHSKEEGAPDNVIDLAAERAARAAKRAGYGAAVIVLTGLAWLLRDRHWLAPIGITAAAAVIGAVLFGSPRQKPPDRPQALPPVTGTPSPTVTSGSAPPATPETSTGQPTTAPSSTEETSVKTVAPALNEPVVYTWTPPASPRPTPAGVSADPTTHTPPPPRTSTPPTSNDPRCTLDLRLAPLAEVCLLQGRP
ncbi:hypothetical protein [Amycolatopsis thermoflava]|uniref:hypothetical protein n=1 Tax=Amycolatopsis thermoflava TaxID=84480 RepID=UPI00380DEF4B